MDTRTENKTAEQTGMKLSGHVFLLPRRVHVCVHVCMCVCARFYCLEVGGQHSTEYHQLSSVSVFAFSSSAGNCQMCHEMWLHRGKGETHAYTNTFVWPYVSLPSFSG